MAMYYAGFEVVVYEKIKKCVSPRPALVLLSVSTPFSSVYSPAALLSFTRPVPSMHTR